VRTTTAPVAALREIAAGQVGEEILKRGR